MLRHPSRAIARSLVLATLLGAAALATATAQTHATHDRDPGTGGATASPDADDLADGEVRKIDRETGRLTLRHGPLRNLDMPGMTMVFDVVDAAVLDRLRPGEKVRFQAGKVDGRFVVVRIEPASTSTP
ncbi:MAG TPA: copper-binding protein [Variovorax sp.]|nr:copper-binding protein [Variovorax sp.]